MQQRVLWWLALLHSIAAIVGFVSLDGRALSSFKLQQQGQFKQLERFRVLTRKHTWQQPLRASAASAASRSAPSVRCVSALQPWEKIGRASCRERGCQYV